MTPQGVVLSCEHASNAVPAGVDLGVHPDVLHGHVAWDPGALQVATALAARIGAPLFAGTVSRLVVDLNRRAGHPDAIPVVAFGTPVPGNAALSDQARARRLAAFHTPHRDAVRAACAAAAAATGCLHLSVHSFDPSLPGDRDHDLGVLFDPARGPEAAIAAVLLAALSRAGLRAAPNAPYLGTGEGFTTALREAFPADRYAGIEIELSQALPARRWVEVVDALAEGVARASPPGRPLRPGPSPGPHPARRG